MEPAPVELTMPLGTVVDNERPGTTRAAPRAEREPATLRLERRAPRRVRAASRRARSRWPQAPSRLAFVLASGDERRRAPAANGATARPARPAPSVTARTVKVGKRPFGLAVGEDGVWVAIYG